ncbi:MAG: thioredoxin family protein [candidate division WOR-3 bacterium]|nr:MAG: thioredoxin family protein [candidate division WOR-3 bacterium]
MKVQILGIGCARCDDLEKRVRNALAELDIAADVEHVTDLKRFSSMGVFMTPGLLIDGKVVSQGRVPGVAQLKAWLEEAQSAKEEAV